MSFLRSLGLVAVALALFLISTPLYAGSEPVEPPTPTVLDATPEEVKILLEHAEKGLDEKNNETLEAVLVDMESRRSEEFEPFIKKMMSSKTRKIQARAIRAAASNEMEDEKKSVLKLLKASKKMKKKKGQGDVGGLVAAAAVDYLARLAVPGVEEEVVEQLNRLFLVESRMNAGYAPDLVRAAVHYLGQTKEMSAVPRLVEMLPEPVPANPNSASNPPATYWEARYKIWQASEGWVRWALKEITGQSYRTHREWKAWVAQNKKKFKNK